MKSLTKINVSETKRFCQLAVFLGRNWCDCPFEPPLLLLLLLTSSHYRAHYWNCNRSRPGPGFPTSFHRRVEAPKMGGKSDGRTGPPHVKHVVVLHDVGIGIVTLRHFRELHFHFEIPKWEKCIVKWKKELMHEIAVLLLFFIIRRNWRRLSSLSHFPSNATIKLPNRLLTVKLLPLTNIWLVLIISLKRAR